MVAAGRGRVFPEAGVRPRPQKRCGSGREWGNVASTVCADEEAMLGGNVDERYGTKTRQ